MQQTEKLVFLVIFLYLCAMDNKIMNALCRCPLFHEMTPFEIEMVLSGTKYKFVNYDKHDVFTLAGMPCNHADIVVRGELVCRMTSLSGKSVEVSRLQEGDVVAPAFIFAYDNKMPVSVETETDTTIMRMRPEELQNIMDTSEKVRKNFIRTLSNINVFLTRKMKVLSLFTVREKISYFLLEEAGKQQSDTIMLDKSRQEIADSFGIQKFSLLRCLSDLARDGAIVVEGRKITIVDRNKMK